MSFFIRYVVIYGAVGILLLGLVAYTVYTDNYAFTWPAVFALIVWLLGYHAVALWLDYRRISRLVADIQAGKFDRQLQPNDLRESLRYLAVKFGGVPDVIAGYAIRRVVTDEIARRLAEDIRARTSSESVSAKRA
jgi:hypothetical protein